MKKLRVMECFGGIGACSKALERLGIEHEIIDYVEIDKYAVKSFNAIHNTNFEPQDICKWNKDIDVDLIMHGSPCQDFSLAGLQAGGDEGSGTRSSLMYETIRIVKKLKPKYVIWENVKNLLSKKHRHNFDSYLEIMESLGYQNYYQVLNAKDYGIPQNRERVFTVSILGNENYKFPLKKELDVTMHDLLEKNIEDKYYLSENMKKYVLEKNTKSNFKVFRPHVEGQEKIAHTIQTSGGNRADDNFIIDFEFPPKQELKLKLKDLLEENVDEKYYLSNEQVERIYKSTYNVSKTRIQEKDYCQTLCARDWEEPKCVRVGGIFDTDTETHQAGSIYDKDGLAPTLDTMQGGWRQPCIEVKNNTKKGYLEAKDGDGINISSRMKYQRGNVQKQSIQTITTSGGNDRAVVTGDLRIRKLTPKECWRLMGFDDEDFEKAEKVCSNTQLYKQAGNSIVVNVLMAIFNELLKNN